jgi:chromosome segregation ATPase
MNDDPANKLPDETQYGTQPTITTVLKRLNEIGDGLRAEIETLRVGQEQLRVGQEQLRVDLTAEIQSLRSEMNQRFADVDKQFVLLNKQLGILNHEILRVRAEYAVYEDRLDKLEQKTT